MSEIDETLRRTLDDGRLSRTERRALREVLEDMELDGAGAAEVRRKAVSAARDAREARGALDWLEDVLNLIDAVRGEGQTDVSSLVAFSPGDACRRLIADQLRASRQAADLCVFTITDDRLAGEILQAAARGVRVRIISDDEKAEDRGSDAHRLQAKGIPVRFDHTGHMHHKFAVFDGRTLLNGSYNWTRSAASENHENVVVSDNRELIAAFTAEFERLWEAFG